MLGTPRLAEFTADSVVQVQCAGQAAAACMRACSCCYHVSLFALGGGETRGGEGRLEWCRCMCPQLLMVAGKVRCAVWHVCARPLSCTPSDMPPAWFPLAAHAARACDLTTPCLVCCPAGAACSYGNAAAPCSDTSWCCRPGMAGDCSNTCCPAPQHPGPSAAVGTTQHVLPRL